MKYHQCEWCEAEATRIFKAHDESYVRYSCSKAEHADWLRRLIRNDGIAGWSEMPFEIEDPAHDPGGRSQE